MRAVLAQSASIAIIVFAVSSIMTVGLAYDLGEILRPLREARAVFRALVANFVLVPILAIGIERIIPMDPPVTLGLLLVAGAAGSPFFIKLASAARSDLALSAALLVLVVPATVIFLPLYVPLAMAHPSLRELSYIPSSVTSLGLPLLSTLFLPLLLGLLVRAVAPSWARRLVPLGGRLATITLVIVVVGTFGANLRALFRIVMSGELLAGILLILGSFVIGFLLSRRERSPVLGLGTAQRNITGAMVIASRSFSDPDVLVMVTACAMLGLILLLPIAVLLGRHAPHLGPPTPEIGPV